MTDSTDFAAYAGRRVLVTGASGFIGRWVARQLTAAGARLWLTARDPAIAAGRWREYAVVGVPWRFDVSAPQALPALLQEIRPAVVFNLAGYGVAPTERDVSMSEAINHRWVAALAGALPAARDASWPGSALVHTGSALEYGHVAGDLHECGPTNPTTVYGQTKLAGAEALRVAPDLPSVTARLFTVYGPGERASRLLPSLMAAAPHFSHIPLTEGRQRRDFTYVEDVAEGLLQLGLARPQGAGQVVNLATGVLTSVRDFVLTAAAMLGISRSRLGFGDIPTRGEEMQHDPVNIQRLQERLDWRPETTVEAGIRRTIEFANTMSAS